MARTIGVIRRGRRVGAVIDDLEAGLLEVSPAAASQGAMRVLASAPTREAVRSLGILCGSEFEEGSGKFLAGIARPA